MAVECKYKSTSNLWFEVLFILFFGDLRLNGYFFELSKVSCVKNLLFFRTCEPALDKIKSFFAIINLPAPSAPVLRLTFSLILRLQYRFYFLICYLENKHWHNAWLFHHLSKIQIALLL